MLSTESVFAALNEEKDKRVMSQPDDEKLPEMNDAVLSGEEVAALFRDYSASVVVREIVVKQGPGHVQSSGRPTLEEAERLLVERCVAGVQVRYDYEHAQWWDTLMPVEDGVRLVRIRHSQDVGG